MPQNISGLIIAAGVMFAVLAGITVLSNFYSLNIKAKTVGHGQHGTARWATRARSPAHTPMFRSHRPCGVRVRIFPTSRALWWGARAVKRHHSPGRYRRRSRYHDRRGGCRQDRLLALPLPGICAGQRGFIPSQRYQRRYFSELRWHRKGLLPLQNFSYRPSQSHQERWLQPPASGQQIR